MEDGPVAAGLSSVGNPPTAPMAPVARNPQEGTAESGQPMAKRQRRGRVVLDVGGEKFVASASTLASNSRYFSALLSGDGTDGDEEFYVDQDPAAFRVLLDYMRSGMVQAAEVSERVLLLAEFLGIERLVSAAKIRWLAHLGRGPHLSNDCSDADIVAAFDAEYGGISEAIGACLFRTFLAMNPSPVPPVFPQYDVAEVAMVPRPDGGYVSVAREFVGHEDPVQTECGALGALNGFCSKGYHVHTSYVADDKRTGTDDKRTGNKIQELCRRKYIQLLPRTENVFAPSFEDGVARGMRMRFQYAFIIYNHGGELKAILAPPEFSSDEAVRRDPFGVAVIQPVPRFWAKLNGFAPIMGCVYANGAPIAPAWIDQVGREAVEAVGDFAYMTLYTRGCY